MLYCRAVLLCGSMMLACSDPAAKEGPAPQPAPSAAESKEVKTEAPPQTPPPSETKAEPTPPPSPPQVTLETKVGVAACDDFVARYRACIDEKVPEREKRSHTAALLAQLTTWSQAQGDSKLAPALADECASAAAAARASTRVLGCVWREGDSPTPEVPKGGKSRPQPRGLLDFEP